MKIICFSSKSNEKIRNLPKIKQIFITFDQKSNENCPKVMKFMRNNELWQPWCCALFKRSFDPPHNLSSLNPWVSSLAHWAMRKKAAAVIGLGSHKMCFLEPHMEWTLTQLHAKSILESASWGDTSLNFKE